MKTLVTIFDSKYPIHKAIRKSSDVEKIKELVRMGFSVNEIENLSGTHQTPLYTASKFKRVEIVRYLIKEAGADPSIPCGDFRNEFALSVTDDDEILKLLLPPLLYAIYKCDLALIDNAIEQGNDVNSGHPYKTTPLIYNFACRSTEQAREKGKEIIEVMKYLIQKHKADVNKLSPFNGNATLPHSIMHAALHFPYIDLSVIEFLVNECGADITIKNKEGFTPADYTRSQGGREDIKKFLSQPHNKTTPTPNAVSNQNNSNNLVTKVVTTNTVPTAQSSTVLQKSVSQVEKQTQPPINTPVPKSAAIRSTRYKNTQLNNNNNQHVTVSEIVTSPVTEKKKETEESWHIDMHNPDLYKIFSQEHSDITPTAQSSTTLQKSAPHVEKQEQPSINKSLSSIPKAAPIKAIQNRNTQLNNNNNQQVVRAKRVTLPVTQEDKEAEKSWHIDMHNPEYDAALSRNEIIFPASQKDWDKALRFYNQHPVHGKDVRSIKVIFNKQSNRAFESELHSLQERHGDDSFKPQWQNENENKNENEAEWRRTVHQMSEDITSPHIDPDYPNVKLFPGWHGTKSLQIVEKIAKQGFANLATTDKGFFGKGIYFTDNFEYALRVYSQGGAVIMAWVCFYSAYPTIHSDMKELLGKANKGNYDAHFVPVIPPNGEFSNTAAVYHPCKPNQKHQYIETVVFSKTQCLPRYVIELQPSMPKALSSISNPIDQNVTESALYKKAVEGHANSQAIVGHYYEKGDKGFPKDTALAVFWYEKAATQKLPLAQRALAKCYERGIGIEKDISLAIHWYQEAVKNGATTAQTNVDILTKKHAQNFESTITKATTSVLPKQSVIAKKTTLPPATPLKQSQVSVKNTTLSPKSF